MSLYNSGLNLLIPFVEVVSTQKRVTLLNVKTSTVTIDNSIAILLPAAIDVVQFSTTVDSSNNIYMHSVFKSITIIKITPTFTLAKIGLLFPTIHNHVTLGAKFFGDSIFYFSSGVWTSGSP